MNPLDCPTQPPTPGRKSSTDQALVDPQGEQEWQLYDDAHSRCPPRDGPYV